MKRTVLTLLGVAILLTLGGSRALAHHAAFCLSSIANVFRVHPSVFRFRWFNNYTRMTEFR